MRNILQVIILVIGVTLSQSRFLRDSSESQELDTHYTDIAQEMADGFWKQLDLVAPQDLVTTCFTEIEAQTIVETTSKVLSYIVQNNTSEAIKAGAEIRKNLGPSIAKCVSIDSVTQTIKDAFGIENLNPNQLSMKIGFYYFIYTAEVYKKVLEMNDYMQDSDFSEVGQAVSEFLLKVFKN